MSIQPVNLFNFGDGHLKFSIKIPSNISFQIGIIDAWGNQSYVEFPANQNKYGLSRNGEWGQASIPVEDIRGYYIDLRMLSYEFVILEVNGAQCEFGLDDIYWESGGTVKVINSNQNTSPKTFLLKGNYPNPFNPVTTLSYELLEPTFLEVTIYDIMGNVVNNLLSKKQTSGHKILQWDATDNQGKPVSAGVYIYRISSTNFSQNKKMILLK